MFNKTAIIKNQILKFTNPKPAFHKTINMKKYLTNLKMNCSNNYNNYSDNTSNINIKTSPNSKILPGPESIRKVQTQIKPMIKNFLFDEKEMNNTFRKFSAKKSSIIKKAKNNISLSAKFNKHFKKSSKSRAYLYTNENEKQNNMYYLSGEVQFKDKYIVEIAYNSSSIDTNKRIKNGKNEIIQVEEIKSNFNDDNKANFKSRMLNMRKKDKKIEKLAKKLAIKLNLEDKKYTHQSKCGCGNLITLNNGFFNGVNLVLNYPSSKVLSGSNKLLSYNKTEGNYKHNRINPSSYANGYNFIPNNLPIFLRDKYNIKGTSVLSPFCIEARDEFLFKKIFYEGDRIKLSKRGNIIDNKLNIFYAENYNQYDKKLRKLNEKLKVKGRRIIHKVGPTPTEIKLKKIRDKMSFMKKIVDYAYPNMVLARVRENEKIYKKKNLSLTNIPPFKRAEIDKKKNNKFLGDFLRKSINIQTH